MNPTCKTCHWAEPAKKKDPEKADGFYYCHNNGLYMWGDDYCTQHPEVIREKQQRQQAGGNK